MLPSILRPGEAAEPCGNAIEDIELWPASNACRAVAMRFGRHRLLDLVHRNDGARRFGALHRRRRAAIVAFDADEMMDAPTGAGSTCESVFLRWGG